MTTKVKEVICHDLGCVYRWNEQYKELEWVPMMQDGSYSWEEEGSFVDEDLVGGEVVTYNRRRITLSEVYRDIEHQLGVSKN